MQLRRRHRLLVRADRIRRPIGAGIGALCAALLVASCSHTVVNGRAVSMLYDPDRVGGLLASDGPSGPRGIPPPTTGRVRNTDGGGIDRLALSAIDDIEDFWKQHYSDSFSGTFKPVSRLLSYDSNDPLSPPVCGGETYRLVNAFYCHRQDLLAWDRRTFLPVARKYFGDMAVNGVLAHEYGHALQWRMNLVNRSTQVLVKEQQADCFAGVYLHWVAEGHSPRFTLSTGDGLNRVLAGVIYSRDTTPEDPAPGGDTHGSALDRVTAFQRGFDNSAEACAEINMDEINQRRGDLPASLFEPEASPQSGEVPIDNDTLSTLMELLGKIFAPADPPTLSTEPTDCPDVRASKPASYCPATNTIGVDLRGLQDMGASADEESQRVLLQGDNTALSVVTSRYMLALQRERGIPLDSAVTAMRTACLTGVAQRQMAEPIHLASGKVLVLAAGDLDEAVSGLLTNGLVASDVKGTEVPAGFTRIFAFHSGLLSDADQCYQRFS